MKAFFAVLILVALLSQGLQACGGNKEVNSPIGEADKKDLNTGTSGTAAEPAPENANTQDEQLVVEKADIEGQKVATTVTSDPKKEITGSDNNNSQNSNTADTKQSQERKKQMRVLFGKKQLVNPTGQTPNPLTTELEVFRKKISGLII